MLFLNLPKLRSAEIEGKYSFIILGAIYSIMLISELCVLFEKHLKLTKSKETSEEAKDVTKNIIGCTKALIDPLLGFKIAVIGDSVGDILAK